MKIIKMKKIAGGKYKLEFKEREKLITYDEVILKHNLLLEKEWDPEFFNQIQIETTYYDSYYKALKYIMTKMRSVQEITLYLNRLGIDQKDQERMIIELKNKGLLDDKAYLKAYIADKINLSNMGPYLIQSELEKQAIPSNEIQEELKKYDSNIFEQKMRKIIEKKIHANHTYSKYQLKQKITLELINLGYEKSDILTILEEYSLDDSTILEHEYQILYRKLSSKYEGNILFTKIKNKLYQKGFSLNEINQVIEKNIN